MKTIKEWLQDLPDGYRELALEEANPSNLDGKCDGLYEAINGIRVWKDTSQGRKFWSNVSDSIYYNNPNLLPPLPFPKEYTLEQAIEKLGKEGWVFKEHLGYADNGGIFDIDSFDGAWEPHCKDIKVKDFPTVLDQLKAAIEACKLLNGAKQ